MAVSATYSTTSRCTAAVLRQWMVSLKVGNMRSFDPCTSSLSFKLTSCDLFMDQHGWIKMWLQPHRKNESHIMALLCTIIIWIPSSNMKLIILVERYMRQGGLIPAAGRVRSKKKKHKKKKKKRKNLPHPKHTTKSTAARRPRPTQNGMRGNTSHALAHTLPIP